MAKIYGVDPSKRVTPRKVRDAIVRCFIQAHNEVLNVMDEYTEWESKTEREHFRNIQVELIIKNTFNKVGEDYDNPTKNGLKKVVSHLSEYAVQFRKPEIVQRHASGIMKLIDKIEE